MDRWWKGEGWINGLERRLCVWTILYMVLWKGWDGITVDNRAAKVAIGRRWNGWNLYGYGCLGGERGGMRIHVSEVEEVERE